jgi:hypothetical protein
MGTIKNIVIEAAGRSYIGANERAPWRLGATVPGATVESSGWPPELFFTSSEQERLMNLGPVTVG